MTSSSQRLLRLERQNPQGQEPANMSKQPSLSKTAVVLTVLTVCAIAGVAMVLQFKYSQTPLLMRLPRNVLPHSYRVVLQPHLHTQVKEEENGSRGNQTLRFDGLSVVNFHCLEKTWSICLHSKDLQMTKTPIVKNQRRNMPTKVTQAVFHHQSDVLEILLEEPLEEGEDYSLRLMFLGQMSETPQGLFMSTYEEGGNEDNKDPVR